VLILHAFALTSITRYPHGIEQEALWASGSKHAVSAKQYVIRPCKPLYIVRKENMKGINPSIITERVTSIRLYTTLDASYRVKRHLAIKESERRFGTTYSTARMLKLLLLTAGKISGWVSHQVVNFRTILRAGKATPLVPLVNCVDRTDIIYFVYTVRSQSLRRLSRKYSSTPLNPRPNRSWPSYHRPWLGPLCSRPQPGSTDQVFQKPGS